jgi:hypothetical protein
MHTVHVLCVLVTWQTTQASDGATRAVENVAVLDAGTDRGLVCSQMGGNYT